VASAQAIQLALMSISPAGVTCLIFRAISLIFSVKHSTPRERPMRAFPQNPMTDGMAWSGFDRAAANIPGGAEAVFRAVGVSQAIVDRPGRQATFRQYVAISMLWPGSAAIRTSATASACGHARPDRASPAT
jgi:hypothetical protein